MNTRLVENQTEMASLLHIKIFLAISHKMLNLITTDLRKRIDLAHFRLEIEHMRRS